MLLIQKLNDCGLMREIWPYLIVRDITCLFVTNKNVQTMCLRINEVVSQVIILNFHDWSEETRGEMLKNMISTFPNISKLTSKYYFTIRIKQSLRNLYNCESICRSLQDLIVCIGSDEGVKGISRLRNIKYLNISDSNVTNNAMSEIGCMMSITSLDCSICKFIRNDGLFHISKLLKLKLLDISENNSITDSGLSHLSCLTNMTSLNISTLSPISCMSAITSLNISGCDKLTDEGFSFVSSLINMISLNISCCEITTLSPISFMTNLKLLDIICCNNLTDYGFSFISSLSNITSLEMYKCKITTLFPISPTLTNITLLNLSSCVNLTDEGLSFITSLINLTDLNLKKCFQITDNGLSFITCLMKIIKLDIRYCEIFNDGLDYISYLTNIKKLKMTLRNGITTEGFIHFCKLKYLNEISFGSCVPFYNDDNFDDINLFPEIINKFLNIKEFYCYDVVEPVDGVNMGFLYIQELRRRKK